MKHATIIAILVVCTLAARSPCALAEDKNPEKQAVQMITPAAQRSIDNGQITLTKDGNDSAITAPVVSQGHLISLSPNGVLSAYD